MRSKRSKKKANSRSPFLVPVSPGKYCNPQALPNQTLMLAERTGLEPATPDVTGRYSNQLNYHS